MCVGCTVNNEFPHIDKRVVPLPKKCSDQHSMLLIRFPAHIRVRDYTVRARFILTEGHMNR